MAAAPPAVRLSGDREEATVSDSPTGRRPHVLVVGGGVAALELVLALAELAPGRADVEFVTPESVFTYRPLAVADTFGAGRLFRIELARVAAHADARLHAGRVVSFDTRHHVAFTTAGEQLHYDVLVVACGARADEWLSGALTFRGEQDEDAFRYGARRGPRPSRYHARLRGSPHASWPLPLYELALMSAAELKHRRRTHHRLALVTPEERPLARFDGAASEAVSELLDEAGIEVHCGCSAVEVADGELELAPAGRLAADRVVTLPQLRGPHLAGLPRDADGFVPTDRHGRVVLDSTTSMPRATRPPSRSSRADSPLSRPMPSPNRLRRASACRSGRRPSGR